jgi:hypothetical protein
MLSDLPFVFLIFINLLPIIGVIVFDWKAFPVLCIYFLEGLITIIFGILKIIRSEDKTSISIYKFNYIVPIFFSLYILAFILLMVFSIPNTEKTWHSIINAFGIFSIILIILNRLIREIYNLKIYQKRKPNKNHTDASNYSSFGLMLLLVIVFITAKTMLFEAVLIILILIKTFLELRSYLRRQTVIIK